MLGVLPFVEDPDLSCTGSSAVPQYLPLYLHLSPVLAHPEFHPDTLAGISWKNYNNARALIMRGNCLGGGQWAWRCASISYNFCTYIMTLGETALYATSTMFCNENRHYSDHSPPHFDMAKECTRAHWEGKLLQEVTLQRLSFPSLNRKWNWSVAMIFWNVSCHLISIRRHTSVNYLSEGQGGGTHWNFKPFLSHFSKFRQLLINFWDKKSEKLTSLEAALAWDSLWPNDWLTGIECTCRASTA